jgi:hypothetical protein
MVSWRSVHPQTNHATIQPTLSVHPMNRLLWQFALLTFWHLYDPSRSFLSTPALRWTVCHMWHDIHPPWSCTLKFLRAEAIPWRILRDLLEGRAAYHLHRKSSSEYNSSSYYEGGLSLLIVVQILPGTWFLNDIPWTRHVAFPSHKLCHLLTPPDVFLSVWMLQWSGYYDQRSYIP